MYSEARKMHLLEEVIKVKSEAVLIELEGVLKKSSSKVKKEKEPSIYDFLGILSKKEASQMRKAIAETCETIDENEWK
jgi:hypothetical protein